MTAISLVSSHISNIARGNQDSIELTPPTVTLHKVSPVNKENLLDNSILSQSSHNCTQKPDWLTTEHWKDLLKGGRDPLLVSINCESVSEAIAKNLLYPKSNRKLWQKIDNSKLYSKYQYGYENTGAGWVTRYQAPFSGKITEYCQIRFDNPSRETGKIDEAGNPTYLRYGSPAGSKARLFFARVSLPIWQKVAAVNNAKMPPNIEVKNGEALGFWRWVSEHREIPIIITEGVKKSLTLLSSGRVSVSVPGVTQGFNSYSIGKPISEEKKEDLEKYLAALYTQKQYLPAAVKEDLKKIADWLPDAEIESEKLDWKEYAHLEKVKLLSSDLIPFALGGRRSFIFAFDNDSKPSTIKAVNGAAKSTANCLEKYGCTASSAVWFGEEKGIDDYAEAFGISSLDDIFATTYPLEATLKGAKKLNIADLSTANIPLPKAKIIGIKSPQGTGKTLNLNNWITPLLNRGEKVLFAVHRDKLVREASEILGIPIRQEKSPERHLFGMALCIQSLHKLKPSDYAGATFILDEFVQVWRSVLTCSTCKENRLAILDNLKEILKVCDRVIVLDADLCNEAINWLLEFFEGELPSIELFENEYFNTDTTLAYFYESQDQIVVKAIKEMALGGKVLLQLSAVDSTFGSKVIEEMLAEIVGTATECSPFLDKKILRLDRESVETVGSEANLLYSKIGQVDDTGKRLKLGELLIKEGYDFVIATPLLETGVSIPGGYFTGNYHISSGIQEIDAVNQSLWRIRDVIPRHIYITKKGFNFYGHGELNSKALRASIETRFQFVIKQLHSRLPLTFDDEQAMSAAATMLTYLNDENHLNRTHFKAAIEMFIAHNKEQKFPRHSLIKKLCNDPRVEVIEVKPEAGEMATFRAKANLIKPGLGMCIQWDYFYSKKDTAPPDKDLKEILKVMAAEIRLKASESIAASQILSDNQVKEIERKPACTLEEKHAVQKTILHRMFPGIELDKDFVHTVREDRMYYRKLQMRYFFTSGNAFTASRDTEKILALDYAGRLDKNDTVRTAYTDKIHCLKVANLEQFLDPDGSFTQENLEAWYRQMLLIRKNLKDILGIEVVKEASHQKYLKEGSKAPLDPKIHSPIRLAQKMLALIGRKLEASKVRDKKTKKILRVYRLVAPPPIEEKILENWLERDTLKFCGTIQDLAVAPPSNPDGARIPGCGTIPYYIDRTHTPPEPDLETPEPEPEASQETPLETYPPDQDIDTYWNDYPTDDPELETYLDNPDDFESDWTWEGQDD